MGQVRYAIYAISMATLSLDLARKIVGRGKGR
jgi:hypothetical protein